jgi:opacity protein-like surface antigen
LAPTDAPTYRKNRTSLTSKAGVRFTPIDYFYLDVWYERTDVRFKDDWTQDDGSISITVGLKNYF